MSSAQYRSVSGGNASSRVNQRPQYAQHAPAPPLSVPSQASLQQSLQALNGKIVQAQSLALANGLHVDQVLARMGGLNETELGLLRLCAAREQEAKMHANLVQQQYQLEQLAQVQQGMYQQRPSQRQDSRRPSPNWQDQFAQMTLGNENLPRTAATNRVPSGTTPPTTATLDQSGKNRVTGKSGLESTSGTSTPVASATNISSTTPPVATGKHEQATSWRASVSKTGVDVTCTVKGGSGSGDREKAVNGFNGVFGNRVSSKSTSATKTSPNISDDAARHERSASACSSHSSNTSSAGVGGRDLTSNTPGFNSSFDSLETSGRGTPSPEIISTPPVLSSEEPPFFNHSAAAAANGGGSGKGMMSSGGHLDSYFDSRSGSRRSISGGGPGIIGQPSGPAFKPQQQPPFYFSTVVRQPHGPPGGADELGNKNFASRVRQKAVSDLAGVLGRRRATSPMPTAVEGGYVEAGFGYEAGVVGA